MIRGLKVALIVYGAINILFGLTFMVAPYQIASMMGFGEIADYVPYLMALCGVSFIVPWVWLIVAGRDPLRHITWVKFAITWSILMLVAGLYSVVQGAVNFSQVGPGIILDGVFAAAFLVFYPWRAARGSR